jgi:serine/threonine-protein kinase HipA
MRIGGEDRPDWVIARRWVQFSADVGIRWRLLEQQLRSMSKKIVRASQTLKDQFRDKYGEHAVVAKILDIIRQRSTRTLLNLEAQEKAR